MTVHTTTGVLALGLLLVTEAPLTTQGAFERGTLRNYAPLDEIWFAFDYSNSITAYSTLISGGGFRPRRTISGDRTGLSRPAAVAVDSGGKIYVTNSGNHSITVYAPGAAGNVAPIRTVRGPSTGLATPRGIALDGRGAIYVANESRQRITVYAPDAEGNALPIRSIWGSRTELSSAQAVAVDRHGALFVTGSASPIRVFAPGADGNVRPVRDFRSTAYGPVGMKSLLWQGVAFPHAIAFDGAGLLYLADWGGKSGPSIQVYPPDSRGITASLRTISGENTGLDYPISVSIDSGGFVYVLNQSTSRSITVYSPGAFGDVPPIVILAGDAPGRMRPSPWDRPLGEVADSAPAVPTSVSVFPPGAAGDMAPEKEITGLHTGFHVPVTLTLADDGELYVLNCHGRVTVHAPDARGDSGPTREFGRASPPVRASPTGIAVDRSDTAFISFVRHEDVLVPGWTEVYVPGAVGHAAPVRQIDFFTATFNGLALDASDYLYAGLGESGFMIMHKSQILRPMVAGEKPQGPDANPSTPGWDPFLVLRDQDDELFWPGAFGLDSRKRVYVPNRDDAVRVYRTGSGDRFAPLRTLSGPRTELDQPVAVALGRGDTLFVANVGVARGSSITVYPPDASGDVPPLRTLRGPHTGLGRTGALAIDPTGRLYVLRKSPPGERCPSAAQ